jgi:hypothetical protein
MSQQDTSASLPYDTSHSGSDTKEVTGNGTTTVSPTEAFYIAISRIIRFVVLVLKELNGDDLLHTTKHPCTI